MDLLKMSGINKSFFGTPVLHDVSLNVGAQEVHALLGENGAGKSTLMNILAGVYTRDKGSIVFNGKELGDRTVKQIEEIGIAFVHQELNIFNDLRVYENLFLGKEKLNWYRRLEKKQMIQETHELLKQLGVDIDPNELADNLDTGKKQLLEIAKAFHADAKLIILDEPTTALNTDEIEKFFSIIRNMKKMGKSFIFISHKMPEIFQIADRYSVLRNGELISTGSIKETTPEQIARDMVGNSYTDQSMYVERKLGGTILELKDVSAKGFNPVSFSVRKGEIVGLTGLKGSGCSEVLQTIFGVDKKDSGKIYLHGKEIQGNTIHHAMRSGIAMVAANRKENSVIQDMNILENMCISEHSLSKKVQHIYSRRENQKYEKLRDVLNIRAPHQSHSITALSGGNQQKVILARWLNTKAEIFLFDNPTQGIDVGAKNEIYSLIMELSMQGKTIIVNTLEIPELEKIADRCIIFYHGDIIAELNHSEITEEAVMLYTTNAVNVEESEGGV